MIKNQRIFFQDELILNIDKNISLINKTLLTNDIFFDNMNILNEWKNWEGGI